MTESPKHPMTLAGLIERLKADPELAPSKVRNTVSAIRTFAKAVGGTLQMEASFPVFRQRIAQTNPAAFGIGGRHWSNIKSSLKFALERYGAPTRAPLRKKLSPAWTTLRNAVDVEPRLTRGLSSLMHWASAHGIEPDEVSNTVLDRYEEHLRVATLNAEPEQRRRDTCQLWNKAAKHYQIWPDIRLTVPDRRHRVSLPWQDFPKSFLDDLNAYCRFMAGEDLLAAHAPKVPRRPKTLEHHREQIHRLASSLVRSGFPIEQLVDLAVLIAKPNLEKALRWYADWLRSQRRPSLRELIGTMVVLAREYLRVDEARTGEIEILLNRLPRRPRGMTAKNRERLRALLDPLNQRRLLFLADRLLNKAKTLGAHRAALMVQRALAHELLLAAPMRFGNLVGLHLEKHFRFIGKGRNRRVIIVIAPEEVKNAQLLEFDLPEHVIGLLDLYLEQHRPKLLKSADPGWLFPGESDGHKHAVGLREQLCEAVKRHAGLTVNPHLYRHIAAFFYLQAHPGAYETVRRLLGHTSVDTTIAFYAEFEGLAARRLYVDHLLERRADALDREARL
jgi:integrase